MKTVEDVPIFISRAAVRVLNSLTSHLEVSLFACRNVNREEVGFPAAAAKSHQSCPTLCDPVDGSPPGSPVPGILQARTPEWVVIKSLSRVRLFATPWTAAHQAPPSLLLSGKYGLIIWSISPKNFYNTNPLEGSLK